MSKQCKKRHSKIDAYYKGRKTIDQNEKFISKRSLKQIELNMLSSLDSDTSLFIIGNGFDLMHGVSSSFSDFKNAIDKNSTVKFILETFINVKDVWGDFENSLAYLDRESMLGVIDMWFENFGVLDEDDDDFSAADYFAAQEAAIDSIPVLTQKLPITFRKWVESLEYEDNNKPQDRLISKKSKCINFNYTEFLETIYGVGKDNILYIHGDRRDKKTQLVLGHGHSTEEIYIDWFENNKNIKDFQPKMSKGRIKYDRNDNPIYLGYFLKDETLGNWKSQARYDAINKMVSSIESYYDNSAKKTLDVIENNKSYFENLDSIENIVVIGHSLSDVDIPYFKEIIDNNSDNKAINWHFSWHSLPGLESIVEFVLKMKLDFNNIKIFKT